jgi:hypothetical protein
MRMLRRPKPNARADTSTPNIAQSPPGLNGGHTNGGHLPRYIIDTLPFSHFNFNFFSNPPDHHFQEVYPQQVSKKLFQ